MAKKQSVIYQEKKHYDFIDLENSTVTGILLKIKGYENIKYHYNRAGVIEEDGVAKLGFEYKIVDSSDFDIDELNADQKFHTIMGDILQGIIVRKLEPGSILDKVSDTD